MELAALVSPVSYSIACGQKLIPGLFPGAKSSCLTGKDRIKQTLTNKMISL